MQLQAEECSQCGGLAGRNGSIAHSDHSFQRSVSYQYLQLAKLNQTLERKGGGAKQFVKVSLPEPRARGTFEDKRPR